MWGCLRDGRCLGHKFRRQHPIDPYFADFACVELKLIIELDGAGHQFKTAYDQARDEFLQRENWTILRVGNDDVVLRLHAVMETIVYEIDRILRGSASPSP